MREKTEDNRLILIYETAASIIQLIELFILSRSFGVIAIFLLNKLGDLLDRVAWLNAKLPNLATNYFITARKKATKKDGEKSSRVCPR